MSRTDYIVSIVSLVYILYTVYVNINRQIMKMFVFSDFNELFLNIYS